MVLLVYPSRGCLQGWRFHPSIDKSSQHGNVFCNSNLTILAPKKEKRKLLFCVQTQPPRTDLFIRSSPASGVIVIVNFKATSWDRPCHLTGFLNGWFTCSATRLDSTSSMLSVPLFPSFFLDPCRSTTRALLWPWPTVCKPTLSRSRSEKYWPWTFISCEVY